MNTLITPSEVVRIAAADGEQLPPRAVTEADIAAAEEQHIVPVIGQALYTRLMEGAYGELKTEYVLPAAACCVRAAVQPRLDVRTGQAGTAAPRTSWSQPAGEEACRALRQALWSRARGLVARLSRHLAAHAAEFPEYDPRRDIRNRCCTDGGLVQSR